MTPPLSHDGFRLGDWRVEPESGLICRESNNGNSSVESRRLEPRVMDLLLYLAEHPGDVCSKRRLLDQVWPGVAVQEVALARAVSTLRRQLGDDSKAPRFIETLPKRGYRLIVEPLPLDRLADSSVAPGADSSKVPEPRSEALPEPSGRALPSRIRSDAFKIWTLAWIVALVPWLVWRLEPAPRRPSIMVLPFQALSSDAEVGFLAAGLSQDIRDRLARRPGLRVISETASKGVAEGPRRSPTGRRIDRRFGGSLQPSAAELIVRLWLEDPQTDEQIWSTEHRVSRDRLLAFQEQLLREMSTVLDVSLEAAPGSPAESLSGAAFDTYLRARARYRRRTAADNAVAQELYRLALSQIEPTNTRAAARILAGLANALALETANYGGGREAAQRAEALARQAVELNPDLAESHKALGTALHALERRHHALTAYQHALRLRPGYPEAVHNRSFLRRQLGEWDGAGRWQVGAVREARRPLK